MRRALALLLAAALALGPALPAAAAAAAGREAPRLELERGGMLAVVALPDVLSRPEVREHLTTGLTSSLALQVTAVDSLGRRAKGGGRVDVRYELWDEVFLVRATGIDGAVRRESLPSFDRLVAWWQGLRLPAVATGPLDRAGPWRVEIRVGVIPFSQAEEQEARRWFSESVQKSGARELSQAADDPSEGLSGVLDLLVATSIQRRSLVRYDWNVTFRPGIPPERRR